MTEQASVHGQSDVVWLRDEAATVEVLERAVAGLWDVVAHPAAADPARELPSEHLRVGARRTRHLSVR
jgi:hypothetical protein